MAKDYSSATEDEKIKYLNELANDNSGNQSASWHELQRKLSKYESDLKEKKITVDEYEKLEQQAKRDYDNIYETERKAREHAWFKKLG